MSKKKSKFIVYFIIIISSIIVTGVLMFWMVFYQSNIKLTRDKQFVYIPSNSTYEQVLEKLEPFVQRTWAFNWAAQLMKYEHSFKSGRYTLSQGMGNRELIQLLRSGKQEPVKIVIQTQNRLGDIVKSIVANLETDSASLADALFKGNKLKELQLNITNAYQIFLPNTYFVNWDIKPDSIIGRLFAEYDKFWNQSRKSKLRSIPFNKEEVVIMASLITKETNKIDEMPVIAGVILNRLRKKMLLQIDPTIKFALQDFSLKRIRDKHIELAGVSPFNTYKTIGLPPGPICNPSSEAIDAVLSAQNHDYIYYCASSTRMGYHDFAVTYSEHLNNARKYQRWLDANGY